MPCAVLVYHSGPERRAIAMDTLDQPPSEQNQPEHTGMESGEGRIEINRGREMSAQVNCCWKTCDKQERARGERGGNGGPGQCCLDLISVTVSVL